MVQAYFLSLNINDTNIMAVLTTEVEVILESRGTAI
jgi:hypothetical protein